ncbi:MAG TPA: EF-P lysine aminoacylase EpmA [Syntrophales bacterium]|nr:EF-P lysine aminoacylase EpmA [Syntrophales bacterium]HOX94776.1 EF-P lysine aminoacylase EpmA [Syntrophales bacterium]HPI57303.1 EF-P lysine aminoacylase EpmA [Syntrophales bacterium]HPN25183.1 EF-P lysine aminoacylase EpmA [Syntrophales bacterium]HQM29398.1 EF-P lysine aminoacylase EpmA [Syntrophales bacterium]
MRSDWKLPGRKGALETRAALIRVLREFFYARNYLEVETSHRIPAPVPEAHIDAFPSGDWFLHTSPEICMKRVLAAGYPRLFQICRCFRRHERGDRHLPEFTLLEWYRAGIDYRGLMEECEDLFVFLTREMRGEAALAYRGERIDFKKPWERLTVREAFDRFAPVPMEASLEEDLFEEILARDIEPRLGRGKPTFLYDYPAALGALARTKKDDGRFAERFEIYLFGLEIANGFTELTDPEEQRRRFEGDNRKRVSAGKDPFPLPEKFLESLRHLPESAGIALGVDRLAMILCDAASIDEVVAFTPEEL